MKKLTSEQIRIWNYLVVNAQGMNSAIHINDIAVAIRIPDKGTNNDDVRNWITDMVIKHKNPIGTCPNGAFLILNDIEREAAAQFVDRNNRANAVRNNGNYIL